MIFLIWLCDLCNLWSMLWRLKDDLVVSLFWFVARGWLLATALVSWSWCLDVFVRKNILVHTIFPLLLSHSMNGIGIVHFFVQSLSSVCVAGVCEFRKLFNPQLFSDFDSSTHVYKFKMGSRFRTDISIFVNCWSQLYTLGKSFLNGVVHGKSFLLFE